MGAAFISVDVCASDPCDGLRVHLVRDSNGVGADLNHYSIDFGSTCNVSKLWFGAATGYNGPYTTTETSYGTIVVNERFAKRSLAWIREVLGSRIQVEADCP